MVQKIDFCYNDLMLDKIYIDRLKSGNTDEINEVLPAAFLDVNEPELAFKSDVSVKGKAYLAGDHLTLQLDAEVVVEMPCSVCNEPTQVPVKLKNCCLTVALKDIRGAVYDPNELVREVILAELPPRAECAGNCPRREELKPFLKEEEKVFFPFTDLEEK